jgi:O-antigen/teichoic acid export membrane protein
MIAAKLDTPLMGEAAAQRSSFFRQSGWLMIANIAGGILMWAVHFLAKAIPAEEYGGFGVFLTVVMLLPTIPLQMVMAQQTAKALATQKTGELSGLIRSLWRGTFIAWLIGAIGVLCVQGWILQHWNFKSPIGLWITLVILLLSLWMPIFWGALQGQQNFLWLGWSMMFNGVGRITVAAIAVLALGAAAAGMMSGVLAGIAAAVSVAVWHTRALWLAPPAAFDRRNLFNQVGPLILAFFGFQILFTADTLFVGFYFPADTTGHYLAAGTLSRALMWLVGPLAAVMFPRLVHSAAKAQKTDLMNLVLLGTATLAVLGAVSLSLLGPLIVQIAYKQSYGETVQCLPWYAGAMVPLAVANVLLNNLMAKPASKTGPAFCIFGLALAYAFALTRFHSSLVAVLQIVGVANCLLLAICAWFTWAGKSQNTAAEA